MRLMWTHVRHFLSGYFHVRASLLCLMIPQGHYSSLSFCPYQAIRPKGCYFILQVTDTFDARFCQFLLMKCFWIKRFGQFLLTKYFKHFEMTKKKAFYNLTARKSIEEQIIRPIHTCALRLAGHKTTNFFYRTVNRFCWSGLRQGSLWPVWSRKSICMSGLGGFGFKIKTDRIEGKFDGVVQFRCDKNLAPQSSNSDYKKSKRCILRWIHAFGNFTQYLWMGSKSQKVWDN